MEKVENTNRSANLGETGGYEGDISVEKVLELVEEIVLNTQEQGQMNQTLIENQIAVKDAQIDKLHKELEYYKEDAAERYINEVMKSVIAVRVSMQREMGRDKWQTLSAEELRDRYQYIFEDLTDLLQQKGFDAYASAEGDLFDSAVHSAIVEKTNDVLLDKKIKCSVKEGYMKNGKVLIPERVIVYRYQAE